MDNITYWKPCPFCGSSAILIKENLEGYPSEYEIYMKCASPSCSATVPGGHYTTLHNTEEEVTKKATDIWNYRYKFKEYNAEHFNAYVAGVLDSARQAILVRYKKDREE